MHHHIVIKQFQLLHNIYISLYFQIFLPEDGRARQRASSWFSTPRSCKLRDVFQGNKYDKKLKNNMYLFIHLISMD
jgi:hypothetical protein